MFEGLFLKRPLLSLLCAGLLAAQAPIRAQGPAPIDSLGASGAVREREVDVEQALLGYAAMLSQGPEGRQAQAGFFLLQKGDLAGANRAFREALAIRESSAPAHYGLALATYRAGMAMQRSEAFFRQALYHAAQAAVLYPAFEGAYRLLGRIYLQTLDYRRAVDAYVLSLQVDPTVDRETVRGLATAYIRSGAFEDMEPRVVDSLLVSPREADLLPVVAHACAARGAPDLGMQYFGRFLSLASAEERALYQDIGLIASEEERRTYASTEGNPEARREFLVQFWAGRDPDLLTGVNERQLEHYRRVWYARTNFSKRVRPWDRRGEVYIRYGPPDHRARSWRLAPPMSAEVEQVKERIAFNLYGQEAVGQTYTGPVFPIRKQVEPGMRFDTPSPDIEQRKVPVAEDVARQNPIILEADPELPEELAKLDAPSDPTIAQTHSPMAGGEDQTFIRWESWVYTRVAGGVEIVFTDEWRGGGFDYAPVPPPNPSKANEVRRMSRLVEFSPQMVMKRSIVRAPDYYAPGGSEGSLTFYYDHADFRGRDGKTRLEVYYGIPTANLSKTQDKDTAFVSTGCTAALFDSASGEARQEREESVYRASGGLSGRQGDFIPNQLTLEVEPGTYDLRVQVKDLISGRSGTYRKRLEVEDYRGSVLRVSDLELGWTISIQGGMEKYRKGNLYVLPMTTKTYRQSQNPFIYYEVYNLSRDSQNKARFRLDYTVQSAPEKGEGMGRFIAGLGRMFAGEGTPEVSVSSEQARMETDLREYFELNLQKVKAGVNRMRLKVTDLNSGQSVEKEALFHYVE